MLLLEIIMKKQIGIETRFILLFHLILIQLAVLILLLALLLECDDDKTDKNVDHEKRYDDDVDEVEDGDLPAVVVYWAESLAVRVDTQVHQTEEHTKTHVNC